MSASPTALPGPPPARASVDQALRRVRTHLKQGETAAARSLCAEMLRAFPGNARLRQALAEIDTPRGAGGGPKPGTKPDRAELEALVARFAQRDFAATVTACEAALTRYRPADPEAAVVWNILGAARKMQGERGAAMAAFGRAVALDPTLADAQSNLGVLLKEDHRFDEAIACYRKALALRRDSVEACNNLANALRAQGNFNEAITAYRHALTLSPTALEPRINLASVFWDIGAYDEAVATYQQILALRPGYPLAQAAILYRQRQVCDWAAQDRLPELCARLGVGGEAVDPFSILSLEDDPERQMQRSQIWARVQYPVTAPPLPAQRPPGAQDRLRIGYFGADFHDHATLYLMAGLLREHDRTRFEVQIYSYGRYKSGDRRESVQSAADQFFDVSAMGDRAIRDLARAQRLDIAIDLKGYTKDTRSGLFAQRLAPVQIAYLGYPGTMGADFMDYLVADATVIPPDLRRFYCEKVIWLPHCYQPNDDHRAIAPHPGSRAEHGLPPEGLVFCCFNHSYKISPREYDIWMRLLCRVEGAVLWLLASNPTAMDNLRAEAQARGVDPARIIFAEKRPHAEHLARLSLADLFLDTFHVNAHTTASDALWAGLPVVTRAGAQFAARVAASLLHAIGLPELVAPDDAGYEALILALATDPARLAALRSKLAQNRLAAPLFDTRRYTRNFERALSRVQDLAANGAPPQDIRIDDDDR